MGMLENMAGMLRRMKELNGKSIEEWSEELGIASSTLQDYLKGSGNPAVKMVDHLARKLDIDPLALMSGKMEPEQYQIVVLMLDTIKAVAALPHPKRVRFANLFLELTQLWEGNVE